MMMNFTTFITVLVVFSVSLINGNKTLKCEKTKRLQPLLLSDQTSSELILQSPGYPDAYFKKGKCMFTFKIKPKHGVEISCGKININGVKKGEKCKYDKLRIYEGHHKKEYCGQEVVNYVLPPRNNSKAMYKIKLLFTAVKGQPLEEGFSCKVKAVKASSSSEPKCGYRKTDLSRIVGGVEAIPNEFPWQVVYKVKGRFFCGGSLISDRHVMTAAHCTAKYSVSDMKVVLGAHNKEKREPTQIVRKIIKKNDHPKCNDETAWYDFSILTLDKPVQITDVVQPICLPKLGTNDQYIRRKATSSGWGLTENDGFASDVLMKLDFTIISEEKCKEYFGSVRTTPQVLCAIREEGKGVCNGDSGGPLIVQRKGSAQYELVGVNSFVYGKDGNCAENNPDGFARITSVLSWIYDIIKN